MEKPGACARCGSTTKQLAGALCTDCFAQVHRLYSVPKLVAKKCSSCGRLRLGGEWTGEEELAEWVEGKIRPNYLLKNAFVSVISKNHYATAELGLVFQARGAEIRKTDAVQIKFIPVQCLECSRHATGYHEAVIQLRGPAGRVGALAGKIMRSVSGSSFVAGARRFRKGIDILAGSRAATEQVLSELGLKYSVSFKLAGKKKGKRLYRATYCVRV